MSSMYSLTAMTGKEASANRTVVIGTVEINYRVWMLLIWSTLPGIALVAFTWPLIGQFGLFMLPGVWGATIFLFYRRQRTGLRLKTYQAMWDKKRATNNQFFMCGVPIEVDNTDYRTVKENTAPYVAPEAAPDVSLTETLSLQMVPAGVTPVALREDPKRGSPARVGGAAPAPARPGFEPGSDRDFERDSDRDFERGATQRPAPAVPVPAAVVDAGPDPQMDPRFAAGYAAGLDARERRQREQAQRHDLAEMLGQPDPWASPQPGQPPHRTPAPAAVPFAPAPESVTAQAHDAGPSRAGHVAAQHQRPEDPVHPVHPDHHLDPALIGVEPPDPFDVTTLIGHDATPQQSRPWPGTKDHS